MTLADIYVFMNMYLYEDTAIGLRMVKDSSDYKKFLGTQMTLDLLCGLLNFFLLLWLHLMKCVESQNGRGVKGLLGPPGPALASASAGSLQAGCPRPH